MADPSINKPLIEDELFEIDFDMFGFMNEMDSDMHQTPALVNKESAVSVQYPPHGYGYGVENHIVGHNIDNVVDSPMVYNCDKFSIITPREHQSIPSIDPIGNASATTNLDGGEELVLPSSYQCNCCLVLREYVHTDGQIITKLEIHGRLGVISHALLEVKKNPHLASSCSYHLFDFCKKSIEDVKQFLINYCNERSLARFTMLRDPLAGFYEAMSVGIDVVDGIDIDDFDIDLSPSLSPTPYSEAGETTTEPEPEPEKITKSLLAKQRERASKLRLKDIVCYFHLPLKETSKRLGLCPSVVKKISRKGGMPRWPYRKIKRIHRQIAEAQKTGNSVLAEERALSAAKIRKLEAQLAAIFNVDKSYGHSNRALTS